jgi:hypothetical protein
MLPCAGVAAWTALDGIDRAFPSSESKEALEYLRSGKHAGKIVIKME